MLLIFKPCSKEHWDTMRHSFSFQRGKYDHYIYLICHLRRCLTITTEAKILKHTKNCPAGFSNSQILRSTSTDDGSWKFEF